MNRVEYHGNSAIKIDDTGAEGHKLFMAIKHALRNYSWTGHQNADNFVFEFEDDEALGVAKNVIKFSQDPEQAIRAELRKLTAEQYLDLQEAYFDMTAGITELVDGLHLGAAELSKLARAAERIKTDIGRELGILGKVL